jgi:hypothetical protein
MKNLKSTTLALLTTTCLAGASFNSMAMDPYIETALIQTCKAAKSNNIFRYNAITDSYNLKDKTVALKVMCNGDDIIAFAEKHGADRTAAKLQRSIGNVNIIDVAAISKINVTFEE